MLLPVALLAVIAGLTSPGLGPEPSPSTLTALRQDRDPNTCAARAEWLADGQMTVRRSGVVQLTLFTAVGWGAGSRCNMEVSLSVAFFDGNGALVCSGPVDLRPLHTGVVSYRNLEVQPGNIYEFLRWIDGPRATSQQWARVTCMSADGQTEAQATDFERMRSLRLHAVAPGNTSVGVAEIRMILQP